MNKKTLIPLIIAIILVLGFIVAAFFPESTGCTKMGCPCGDIEGERPCNSCKSINPVFMLGLINVAKVCSAQEIIICENGKQIDRRIEFNKNNCEYKWYFYNYR